MRSRRTEDSSVWIGYADFLTTLVVLFFVMAVSFAGRLSPGRPGFVIGSVRQSQSSLALTGCLVRLGGGRQKRSNSQGNFQFRVDSLREKINIGIAAECDGYADYSEITTVSPRETTLVRISLQKVQKIEVETLSGDALFGSSAATLQPAAIDTIKALGARLKMDLREGEVIAVQGHTDDVPFADPSLRDNWVLSGERAAAAAKILTDSVGISPCKVAIMGFGPSRPASAIAPDDPPELRRQKRQMNRRIEFRRLRGTDIIGGKCSG